MFGNFVENMTNNSSNTKYIEDTVYLFPEKYRTIMQQNNSSRQHITSHKKLTFGTFAEENKGIRTTVSIEITKRPEDVPYRLSDATLIRNRNRWSFAMGSVTIDATITKTYKMERNEKIFLFDGFEIEAEVNSIDHIPFLNITVKNMMHIIYNTMNLYTITAREEVFSDFNYEFNTTSSYRDLLKTFPTVTNIAKNRVKKDVYDIKQIVAKLNDQIIEYENIIKELKNDDGVDDDEIQEEEQVLNRLKNKRNQTINGLDKGIIKTVASLTRLEENQNSSAPPRYTSVIAKPRDLHRHDISVSVLGKGYNVTPKADGFTSYLYIHPSGVWLIEPPSGASLIFSMNSEDVFQRGYREATGNTDFHIGDLKEFIRNSDMVDLLGTIIMGERIPKKNQSPPVDNRGVMFAPFDVLNMPYTSEVFISKKHSERFDYAKRVCETVTNILLGKSKTTPRIGFYYKPNVFSADTIMSLNEAMNILEKIDNPFITDGYIFTPENEPFMPKNLYIYKYKPWDKLTIDLSVSMKSFQVFMINTKRGTGNGEYIQFDHSDLIDWDALNTLSRSNVIMEKTVVEFKPAKRKDGSIFFTPTRLRLDKSKPNADTTASDVFSLITNPIPRDLLFNNASTFKAMYLQMNEAKARIISSMKDSRFVVDIGSGKGGDISKYAKLMNRRAKDDDTEGYITGVLLVEPDINNFNEMMKRLKSHPLRGRFHVLNTPAENTNLIVDEMIKLVESSSDTTNGITISMMLSMSFFWKNEETLNRLMGTLTSISTAAKSIPSITEPTKFQYVTIDGVPTVSLLNSLPRDEGFSKGPIKMKWAMRNKDGGGNNEISVIIEGSIVTGQTEYPVYTDALSPIAIPDTEYKRMISDYVDTSYLSFEEKEYFNLFSSGEMCVLDDYSENDPNDVDPIDIDPNDVDISSSPYDELLSILEDEHNGSISIEETAKMFNDMLNDNVVSTTPLFPFEKSIKLTDLGTSTSSMFITVVDTYRHFYKYDSIILRLIAKTSEKIGTTPQKLFSDILDQLFAIDAETEEYSNLVSSLRTTITSSIKFPAMSSVDLLYKYATSFYASPILTSFVLKYYMKLNALSVTSSSLMYATNSDFGETALTATILGLDNYLYSLEKTPKDQIDFHQPLYSTIAEVFRPYSSNPRTTIDNIYGTNEKTIKSKTKERGYDLVIRTLQVNQGDIAIITYNNIINAVDYVSVARKLGIVVIYDTTYKPFEEESSTSDKSTWGRQLDYEGMSWGAAFEERLIEHIHNKVGIGNARYDIHANIDPRDIKNLENVMLPPRWCSTLARQNDETIASQINHVMATNSDGARILDKSRIRVITLKMDNKSSSVDKKITKVVKIGMSGTRKGMDDESKKELVNFLTKKDHPLFELPENANNISIEAHHGDCTGADKDFHNICESLDIKIVIWPPLNSTLRAYCKSDDIRPPMEYLERDKKIVDETDFLIAFPETKKESVRSGTWTTIRYARKQKKPMLIIGGR